jgi:hypothetical protein
MQSTIIVDRVLFHFSLRLRKPSFDFPSVVFSALDGGGGGDGSGGLISSGSVF